jgi:hypothetical protein
MLVLDRAQAVKLPSAHLDERQGLFWAGKECCEAIPALPSVLGGSATWVSQALGTHTTASDNGVCLLSAAESNPICQAGLHVL